MLGIPLSHDGHMIFITVRWVDTILITMKPKPCQRRLFTIQKELWKLTRATLPATSGWGSSLAGPQSLKGREER